VRVGDRAPGVDAEFGDFIGGNVTNDLMTINDRSNVTLTTVVRPRPAERPAVGIWGGGPSGLDLVALEGSPAPGTDKEFGFLFTHIVLNGMGSVGFGADLAGANSSENDAIWVGPPGRVELLMREGQTAPGTGGGRFVSPFVPSINGNGIAAFISGVVGGNSGIWVGTPGSLDVLALNGSEAPGTGDARFASLAIGGHTPAINANDQVAFLAELGVGDGGVTPEDNLGLWRGAPGDIELIARKGSVAPGTGGATFADLDLFTINGNGDVAFTALTSGGETGLWVHIGGRTSLVVLEGELFDVDPTDGVDLREIGALHFEGGSGGQDGRRIALNDQRTLVFALDFADGSRGIFTATIPEPSSLLLVISSLAAMLLWPHRHAIG